MGQHNQHAALAEFGVSPFKENIKIHHFKDKITVLGHQANLKESHESKELAELRLQVLVVVKTSDACESKKEIMRLESDLQSEGPQGVLLVLICPMTTPRLS